MSLALQRQRPAPQTAPTRAPAPPTPEMEGLGVGPANDPTALGTPILDGLGLGEGLEDEGAPSWSEEPEVETRGAPADPAGGGGPDAPEGQEEAKEEVSEEAPGEAVAESAAPAPPEAPPAPEVPPEAEAGEEEALGEEEAAAEEEVSTEEGSIVSDVAGPEGALELRTDGGEAAAGRSGEGLARATLPVRPAPDVAGALAGGTSALTGMTDGLATSIAGFGTVPVALEAGRLPEAPDFAPGPSENTEISWIQDVIPDVPNLAEPVLGTHSEGGEMVMSAGPEPFMNLVDDFDPIHLAEIGMEGATRYQEAAETLWAEVVEGPGAEVVEGIDLHVEVPLAPPDLSGLAGGALGGIDGAIGLDAVSPVAEAVDGMLAGVGADLDGQLGDAMAEAQDLQEQIVGQGWDTIQTAQQEALDFGQATLDGLLEKLGEDQLASFEAIAEQVVSGRLDISAMWGDAAGLAQGLLADGEIEADAIRDVFESIIDDLPSIPFIDDIIDEIVDEMLDAIFDMFDDVQGAMNSAYDHARAGAGDLISGVQTFATDSFNTLQTTMEEDVGGFFTETIPDVAGDVADTASEVAGDVGGQLESVGADLVDTATDLAAEAEEGLQTAADAAADLGGEALDAGKDLGEAAVDGASDLGGDALDLASDVGGEALDAAKDLGEAAVDGASDLGGDALDLATDLGEEALAGAGGLLEDLAALTPGDLDGLGWGALRELALAALDDLGAAPTWLAGRLLYEAIQALGAAEVLRRLSDSAVLSIAESVQAAGLDLGISGSDEGPSSAPTSPGPTSRPTPAGTAARGGPAKPVEVGKTYAFRDMPPKTTVKFGKSDGAVFQELASGDRARLRYRGSVFYAGAEEKARVLKLPADYAPVTPPAQPSGPASPSAPAHTPPPQEATYDLEDSLGPFGIPAAWVAKEVYLPALTGILGQSNAEELGDWLHGCMVEIFSIFE